MIMKTRISFFLVCGFLSAMNSIIAADTAKEQAINKDHKLIEGIWRIVSLEINGNKGGDDDVKKLSVVNGVDGTWSLRSDGTDLTKGTSTIDPTQKVKTIDLTPTNGDDKGKVFQGIYELNENTRKLCIAPSGQARPTEFSSAPNSGHILVVFERDKDDAIKRDRQRLEGTWTVMTMEVHGETAGEDVASKLKIVFGIDGSWSFNAEERELLQGTTTIDPLKSPKAIDFTITVGDDKGKLSFGIYEVGETSLRLCVAPSGKDRPGEYTSTAANEFVLITFERR
jgi:uncharacterized protein (TIGR03067 family)